VQIIPGAGLWASAALMLLIPLIAGHDTRRLWDWVASPEHAGGRP
jgi:paraquat-inducible protein A